MKEENFEAENEIFIQGEFCQNIIFVVSGEVTLIVADSHGHTVVLDTLRQGDVIGLYSAMFNERYLISGVAATSVRTLSIHQDFFVERKDEVEGLEYSISEVEKHVQEFGVPVCDYRVFDKKAVSPIKRFQRAVNRLKILN